MQDLRLAPAVAVSVSVSADAERDLPVVWVGVRWRGVGTLAARSSSGAGHEDRCDLDAARGRAENDASKPAPQDTVESGCVLRFLCCAAVEVIGRPGVEVEQQLAWLLAELEAEALWAGSAGDGCAQPLPMVDELFDQGLGQVVLVRLERVADARP